MANSHLVELLVESLREGEAYRWNAWLASPQRPTTLDLTGLSLPGELMYGVDLSRADLRGADFHDANFTRAILRAADLRGANLADALLEDLDLREANLAGTNLQGAKFDKLDRRGCTVSYETYVASGWTIDQLREWLAAGATILDPERFTRLLQLEIARVGTPTLPEPSAAMTTEEKGLLLRRYVSLRHAFTVGTGSTLRRLDFSGAELAGVDLSQADLMGVNLLGANLEGALLAGARLDGAVLARSRLRGANAFMASFVDAVLDEADLSDADLQMALLEGASLRAVTGEPSTVDQSRFDLETYESSGWTPEMAAAWCARGATPVGLNAFPRDAQHAILALQPGLTLYFRKSLPFMNQALVNVVLAGIVGDSSACRAEYSPTGSGSLLRLTGLEAEELARVVDGLAAFFDRPATQEISEAVDRAVRESVDAALPEIVGRALAPMAVLQAQLGERLIKHIDAVYADVARTEVVLSPEVTERLRTLAEDVLAIKLEATGWRFESATGRLVRDGAWAVTTGAAGSSLWALLQWATGAFPAP